MLTSNTCCYITWYTKLCIPKLHISLVGPCFTSVRYKEIHLRGSFCTQISSKFAHYQRHSTLESVANTNSNSLKPQDIQKDTAKVIDHPTILIKFYDDRSIPIPVQRHFLNTKPTKLFFIYYLLLC